MKWTALFALPAGCRAKPPTVADLRFPVAVIFGNSSVVAFEDAAALGTMLITHLNAVTGPPPLLDSEFAIYTITKLGSTHTRRARLAGVSAPSQAAAALCPKFHANCGGGVAHVLQRHARPELEPL